MMKKTLRILEILLVCFPNAFMIYLYFSSALFPGYKDYFSLSYYLTFFYFTITFFVGLFEYKRHNRLRFYLWELLPLPLLILYVIIELRYYGTPLLG